MEVNFTKQKFENKLFSFDLYKICFKNSNYIAKQQQVPYFIDNVAFKCGLFNGDKVSVMLGA